MRNQPLSKADVAKAIASAEAFCVKEIYDPLISKIAKLKSVRDFKVNPFTQLYLANVLFGNQDATSIAKVLVYSFIFPSLATTTGNKLQALVSTILGSPGSTTSGLDIEFYDFVDKRQKFAQLKLGPATINNDDVDPMIEKLRQAKRRARTNNRRVDEEDFVIGVLYGSAEDLNAPYRRLNQSFTVIVGADFWHRVTGCETFYEQFATAVKSIAARYAANSQAVQEAIVRVAADIEARRKANNPDL